MQSEPIIMGLENELAFGMPSAAARAGIPQLAGQLLAALRQTGPGVVGIEPGIMLANGARMYLDGPYFEHATPEVRTPHEIVSYQRAGEHMILQALARTRSAGSGPAGDITLFRAVTDYGNDEHWCGQHVNVLARRTSTEELASCLTPFLVTRYYAGAGGWGPGGFAMTQKNRAVRCVASPDTRNNRGLLNPKNEPFAPNAFKRLHFVHGDALMSELGTFLTVGCTALVCAMLDRGVCVGPAMTLADPLAALHELDGDPSWTRPLKLASGAEAGGLDIQEHYLRAAESYTRRDAQAWMLDVVTRWRWSIDQLRRGPDGLAGALDPYIKERLYRSALQSHGFSLEGMKAWCPAIGLVAAHCQGALPAHADLRGALRERVPLVPRELLMDHLRQHGLCIEDLPRAQAVLRRMQTLDLRYHDIAPTGLYWRLRERGRCNSRVVSDADVLRAAMNAPCGTRAAARGSAIVQSAGDPKARAAWHSVVSSQGTLSLPDPFATAGQWVAPRRTTAARRR
jgi:hypothetical protein